MVNLFMGHDACLGTESGVYGCWLLLTDRAEELEAAPGTECW
jgi:hypothetical protein